MNCYSVGGLLRDHNLPANMRALSLLEELGVAEKLESDLWRFTDEGVPHHTGEKKMLEGIDTSSWPTWVVVGLLILNFFKEPSKRRFYVSNQSKQQHPQSSDRQRALS